MYLRRPTAGNERPDRLPLPNTPAGTSPTPSSHGHELTTQQVLGEVTA